jgi:hypothetical protein
VAHRFSGAFELNFCWSALAERCATLYASPRRCATGFHALREAVRHPDIIRSRTEI